MDNLDYKVLAQLMKNGRTPWSELAEILNLSAPAAADRVRRLEERSIIKGYSAIIDPLAAGCGITAFVTVTLEHPQHREEFLHLVRSLPAIQECHHVAGEDDYLLKLRCAGIPELEDLVSERLKSVKGVIKSKTSIVLSTVKETAELPLHPPVKE